MPPAIMDQNQRVSLFNEELRFPTERQVGFWKPESVPDIRGLDDISMAVTSKLVSSRVEKPKPIGPSNVEHSKFTHCSLFDDRTIKFSLNSNLLGTTNLDSVVQSNSHGFNYENGIFSSSLSELLDKKLEVSSNIASLGLSVSKVNSNSEEEELPQESLKEIEAQTIGDLLPDDDDLLSGVIDDIECIAPTNNGDDLNDDIFFSGGGLELERDDNSIMKSDNVNGAINNAYAGEHSYEYPSRSLLVKNIDSNADDKELKALFEQYGDILMLNTACKHCGFMMISYYDIRAAQNAMKSLQNKASKHRKLDVQYSIPKDIPSEEDVGQGTLLVFNLNSSVSNDYLLQKLSVYGDVKEIREVSQNQIFVEFYDVRSAESALRALNRSDIPGMNVKLEPSYSVGVIRLTQQLPQEMEFEESRIYKQLNSPHDSPPVYYGSIPVGPPASFENVTACGLQSAVRAPINPLTTHRSPASSGRALNLSSPVRVSSEGHYRDSNMVHGEFGQSFEHMKFGFQNIQMVHPHSLPEYHDGLTNGIPYNSSPMHSMAININYGPEGVDNRFLQRVGSGSFGSHSYESGAYGSVPIQNQYIWNNSNAYPHRSSTPIIWNNSPSFRNNILPYHPPQLHGLPRAPAHMLSPVIPFHPHHVGSAPAVNPSIWERRQVELTHNNMFQGRNHMIPTHAAFDAPSDRVRVRRNDISAHQAENKKQFELDIECIVHGEDSRTTLMIKNIPNKYTSKMLLAAIDEYHRGTYDFIYLPIDFKNKCNVGYAFINMINPQQIVPFFQAFNGKKWEKFNSEKVASLAYARIQGKAALIAHFQNSSLMNEDKRCRPIIFHSDGPNAGDQEPFPMGVNIRSRPGRTRTYGSEENNYRSPSTSPDN